jgi:hypothetical protein
MKIKYQGRACTQYNVNIEVSAHDAILESPSSDTPKIERLERKII